MVPLPKRRHSTRRGGKRKASIVFTLPTIQMEEGSAEFHLPHRAYKKDGKLVYKGVVIK